MADDREKLRIYLDRVKKDLAEEQAKNDALKKQVLGPDGGPS